MIPSASADGTALVILNARKSSSFSGWNQSNNGGRYAEIMQTPRLLVGVISAAFLAVFADNFLLTVCVPVFPNYYNGVYDALAIGTLYAAKSAVQLLLNPCVNFIIERRGPRFPLTIGVASLVAAAVCFSYAFSTKDADVSYSIACMGSLLHGLASACITHSCISFVALTHASEYRSKALKVLISGVAAGLLLGSPVGGLCYKYINPWSAFMITALLVVVSILVQFLLFSGGYIVYISENDNDDEISVSLFPLGRIQQNRGLNDDDYIEAAPGACALYTNRYVCIAFVSSIIGSFTMGMLQPLLPLYLEREFLLGVLHQSIVYASAILFYLLGICFIDIFVVQNVPKYRCMIYGLIILGCGMCAMLAATTITITLLCVFVIGLGLAFLETPGLPLLADIIEWQDLGSSVASLALIDNATSLGHALGAWIGPMLYLSLHGNGNGFRVMHLIVGLFALLWIPWVSMLKKVGLTPGQDALEVSGSLFGKDYLAMTHHKKIARGRSVSIGGEF